jgi:glycosyltransferase involved in cell wall biosynthesis
MAAGEIGWSSMRVLRLCSVFEAPEAALDGRGVRFDPVGGMQNHTAQLTRALAALGVRQDVITHRPPGAARHQSLAPGVEVRRFGLPVPWFRQLFSMPAALAAFRLTPQVDLVHAHQGEDLAVLPIGLAAARRAKVPVVVTLHTSLRHTLLGSGPRAQLLGGLGGSIEAAVCRQADTVIALTTRLATRLREDGIAAGRIHVIPPGVNSEEFTPDTPDPFPDIPHPRVVFVGRLAEQKGVDTLIAAASVIQRRDAQIVIVGDGARRRAVEEAIRTRGLGNRLQILGFRAHSHIPQILRHSDLFCLPSRYEELSSAVLEAMRAGLPIVATSVGGVPEALGTAGRIVAPDDPAALARAIDELLSDDALATRLGTQARERARAYEWSELAKRILELYRAAVDNRLASQPTTISA